MKKISTSHIILIVVCFLTNKLAYAQNPIASFTANNVSGCYPLTVQFNNTSTNTSSCFWDFGNGNTSTAVNPSNVYSSPGTYTIKLIATDTNGKQDSTISNNFITVVPNPNANFNVSNTNSCINGNAISFVNTSTNSSIWLWDFGDGNTSTLQNPSHNYLSAGNYIVKLLVQNSFGCTDLFISTNPIHIDSMPNTSFVVNTTSGCSTAQVFNFTSTTPAVSSWHWNFGDGTTSVLQNPSHVYNNAGTYHVTLITSNAGGCADTLVKNNYISISTPQTPAFNASETIGCAPLSTIFTDSSLNAASWLWNFGDGNTSTQQNPSHIYQNTGSYNVSLTINNNNNCTYTISKNNFISIKSNAVSNFSLNNSSGCLPLNVQFHNLSSNATTWLWEFGDGNTSMLQNPSHTYTGNGSYTITLHANNANGCESVYEKTNAVQIIFPNSNFNANLAPGCAPLTTGFNNLSTNSTQWLWNFGDGDTSSQQNPSHTYNTPGDYNVSLIAFNSQGCSDTLTLNSYIHVTNPVSNYTPPPTFTGCVPFTSTFSNSIPGAISWLWNFGDGTTSTQQNPSHTYTIAGFYTVSLTINLNGGCTQVYPDFRTFNIEGGEVGFTFNQAPCPSFIVNFTDTSLGNSTSWFWDFGDSTTSTLQNPVHIYNLAGFYTVILTTTTASGCSNTLVQSNIMHLTSCDSNKVGEILGPIIIIGSNGNNSSVNTPPSPFVEGCASFPVHFNNILSGTTSWLWDFGDGSTSTLKNPFHVYTTAGIFNVKMIGYYSSAASDTVFFPAYVRVHKINSYFNFIPQNNNCLNPTLLFNDSSQNAISWLWNFGDGNTSSLQNPIHTFLYGSNNYSISLTTTNAQGCSSSISKNILIGTDIPIIWADEYSACATQLVNFNCSSANFIAYLWNFGDGYTATTQNPSHAYISGGTFQVTLTTTDNNGCTHNFSLSNPIIIGNPVADFTAELGSGCNSTTINFTNLSSGISSPTSSYCLWNFGDGSTVVWAENPSHVYASAGVYQVSLSAYYNDTCINTLTKTIQVYPSVVANFTYTQNNSCLPITAVYYDSSTTAVSWLWNFGDGSTSYVQNPTHIYSSAPSTGVSLTITDINGCQASISKPNINIFNTHFSASATSGCSPVNVSFSDSSLNASQWLWDFGDGNFSTLQNPAHTYINDGNYTVTLISLTNNGCSDTMIFNSINVSKPKANFASSNPANCAPALVTFTDLSIGATSWLWDFGDSSSSTNSNPSHIYNTPGFYTIKLIASNSLGCSDTLIKLNYISIQGSIAHFNALQIHSCTMLTTQFTDLSFNASSWNWNFGDGNTSSEQNPNHVYQTTGNYTVSLIVFDSIGCTSNFSMQNTITANVVPKALLNISDTVFCTPYSVSFNNQSQNAASFLWNFGDGGMSTLPNPSHIYLNPGNYVVSMVATNELGCSDTLILNPITGNTMPIADFTSEITAGCSPLVVDFTNLSSTLSNASYNWNFGNGTTSSQQNPTTTFTEPGNYSISLVVSNNVGCYDSIEKPALIEVYNLDPPAKSNIIVATVTSNTSTYLVWEPSTTNDFASYRIYRRENTKSAYLLIDSISLMSTTSYSDNNLNTLNNSYCYKIQTVDMCSYALALDSLQEHCTINVSAAGDSTNIQVSWTPYIGATVDTYKVYRMEASDSTKMLLATVSSKVLTFLDTNFDCPSNYYYKIKACNLNGNFISSNSDTSIAQPAYNYLAHQRVDIVRSTVIDNSNVLTEWKVPSIAPEKVTGYTIYRSIDNINFSLIDEVPALTTNYIDNNVDVGNQNYFYQIEVVNSCNVPTLNSNKGSSILLKADLVDDAVKLDWTNYNGWDEGVDYYVIERMNAAGEWESIKIIDGNMLSYEDK